MIKYLYMKTPDEEEQKMEINQRIARDMKEEQTIYSKEKIEEKIDIPAISSLLVRISKRIQFDPLAVILLDAINFDPQYNRGTAMDQYVLKHLTSFLPNYDQSRYVLFVCCYCLIR